MLNKLVLFIFLFRSIMREVLGLPIITSLLDVDMYKYTMMQLNWLKHNSVLVRYSFNNRKHNWKLASKIPFKILKRELDSLKGLKITEKEIAYLASLKDRTGRVIFSAEFLEKHLLGLVVPEINISTTSDGQYKITTKGRWPVAMIVETLVLSIVSELNARYERRNKGISLLKIWLSGNQKLSEKIELLRKYPGIFISDFGTRRRFGKHWQMYVLWRLKRELKDQFHSTSNLEFGMRMNIDVVGSYAHEEDMVYAAIYGDSDENLRKSHQRFLKDWWNQYLEGNSIALTDTFGSDFFFSDFTKEQAESWWGYRPDSKEPFAAGYEIINFLKSNGVDPKSKMVLFSDGLNLETIIALHIEFSSQISDRYGWGTGLMNDMGIEDATFALSIVMKAVAAKWHIEDEWIDTVKLSDNPAKYNGNPKDIERYQSVF